MIFFGVGKGKTVLSRTGVGVCPECDRSALFTVVCEYRYLHFLVLFSFLTEKRYHFICDVCGIPVEMTAADARKWSAGNRVPFIREWGWLATVAALLLLVVLQNLT